ncbi:MAG TPA: tartrate-resistant acid phosphatase type 5 family protein [Chthoniobacterales bacterium]
MTFSKSRFARLLPAKLAPGLLVARDAPKDRLTPADRDGAGNQELQFLVVGDWGRNGRDHQRGVAAEMARVAGRRRDRFVISVGDNFYEDGVTSTEDRQWQTSFEKVYAASSLQVPWYCILGNHDYHGRPQAQLEYAEIHPRWQMPARYYTAVEALPDGQAVRFCFIDTSPLITEYRDQVKLAAEVHRQDAEAQLRWLDQALRHSGERWKVVVGHHPVYSGGEHGTQAELVNRLLPLLRKHNVQVYLNGHEHDLQHIVRNGMHFFTTGAGSQVRVSQAIEGSRFARGVPGFLAMSMNAERLRAEFCGADGTLLYQADIQSAEM